MIHQFDCAHCGVPTTKSVSAGKVAPRFCSRECSGFARRRREDRNCEHCGTTFAVRPHDAKRYCSYRCATDAQRGSGNPNFRGGRRVTSNGYIELLDRAHPRARANGYVYEHIVVAERTLGRPLAADEVVHHRNEDRADNHPENLDVMTRAEHTAHHNVKESA